MQKLVIAGSVTVNFDPQSAVKNFDFTVDNDGAYLNAAEWSRILRSLVAEQVMEPIRTKATELEVANAVKSHKDFGTTVTDALTKLATLTEKGIKVISCSITKVEPDDNKISESIGSKEKETILTAADSNRHERALKASGNERAIKEFEAATVLKLEQDRATLIEQQSTNKKAEATAEAEALKIKLAAFDGVDAGKILGLALIELAKSGRVGTLNIGPEIFTAMQQK